MSARFSSCPLTPLCTIVTRGCAPPRIDPLRTARPEMRSAGGGAHPRVTMVHNGVNGQDEKRADIRHQRAPKGQPDRQEEHGGRREGSKTQIASTPGGELLSYQVVGKGTPPHPELAQPHQRRDE